jgi:endo-1,4-beta-xylanase
VRNTPLRLSILSLAFAVAACSPTGGGLTETGSGGDQGSLGGTQGSGSESSNGGSSATGGSEATGGSTASGGVSGHGGSGGGGGGTVASGGTKASGGTTSSGSSAGNGTGGQAGRAQTGGKTGGGGQAGRGTGGIFFPGAGGRTNTGTAGKSGTGGAAAGGSTSTSTDPPPFDCDAAMPTSGGQSHSGNSQGGTGNTAWQIWSNRGTGTLTTFGTMPAFSSGWSDSGNYLGRIGYEFGTGGKSYDTYGTFTAQFSEKKTGSSGGQWSYIGIYGWSNNPCIEWYIIDDSYSKMPINPGNCSNMKNSPLSVDDGKYTMCVRNTTGTGGDRCGNPGNWNQYYSIRQTNRTCGTISVTEHFKAWADAGNKLGNLLEVKILLEVGGGQGTVDFPIANVMKTQ